MPAPGETRAAIIQLDDFDASLSRGGEIVAFTSIEGERGQAVPRIGNKNWDKDLNDYHGQTVVPCDDTPQVGWIWDGANTFRDTNTGDTASVAAMPD